MSDVVRLEYAYGVCPKCKANNDLRYLIHNDGLVHKPYEIKCINCNSYFKKEDIFGSGEETTPKPITNADRLRSMSDEELAEFAVSTGQGCAPGKNLVECCFDHKDGPVEADCRECWLGWLKQEAKE